MSDQIASHYSIEFANTVGMLLQQKGSRLGPYVTPHGITGAKAASLVDQIGKSEATERTTRYPPMVPVDQPTDRPWVYPSDFDWMDLIDSIDKLRMLSDPQSTYVQSALNALGRAKDRKIIAAFFGDRKTGEQGGTTTSFPAANQIAVNFQAAGNVSLTVAKMREAKRLLTAYENSDDDPMFIGVTAKEQDALLAEVQVTSADFNGDKPVLVEGRIDRFMGMSLVRTELFTTDASGYRRCPVWVKSGMVCATWNEITSDVSRRNDLAGLPIQVYAYGTFGATRTEENKVIEIKCV